MIATAQKWGNSLAVRIPRTMAQDIRLKAGSLVALTVRDGQLLVQPQPKPTYRLGHSSFSADAERQKMSAEGLMGPFALTDPAAGTTGPWYTNGTFGLTAGWELDLWGKNRARVEARIGKVNAQ